MIEGVGKKFCNACQQTKDASNGIWIEVGKRKTAFKQWRCYGCLERSGRDRNGNIIKRNVSDAQD